MMTLAYQLQVINLKVLSILILAGVEQPQAKLMYIEMVQRCRLSQIRTATQIAFQLKVVVATPTKYAKRKAQAFALITRRLIFKLAF